MRLDSLSYLVEECLSKLDPRSPSSNHLTCAYMTCESQGFRFVVEALTHIFIPCRTVSGSEKSSPFRSTVLANHRAPISMTVSPRRGTHSMPCTVVQRKILASTKIILHGRWSICSCCVLNVWVIQEAFSSLEYTSLLQSTDSPPT